VVGVETVDKRPEEFVARQVVLEGEEQVLIAAPEARQCGEGGSEHLLPAQLRRRGNEYASAGGADAERRRKGGQGRVMDRDRETVRGDRSLCRPARTSSGVSAIARVTRFVKLPSHQPAERVRCAPVAKRLLSRGVFELKAP
jgi:hypothetical protein